MLKISPLQTNHEKCGFSRLNKLFQTNINFNNYDEFVPLAKRKIVGNLPPVMIRHIVKNFPDKKAEMIKNFQKGLGLTAKFARARFNRFKNEGLINFGLEELSKSDMALLQRQMSNILNSNIREIFPEKSSVLFNFVDRGTTGNVFKLSIIDGNGKKLMPDTALKIYHKQKCILPALHGNYAEANVATFLKRAMGHDMQKSVFAKHYISDMENAYSLSEFLYPYGDYEFKFTDYTKLFGIHSVDALKSFIGGKIFDLGGFQKLWNFTGDKVTLRYFKKLMNNQRISYKLLERYETLANNPKTPHREKITDAIDLYLEQTLVKNDCIKEALNLWSTLVNHK